MNPYLMIAIAVCAEVFADSMLKASQGFKYKLPVVGIVIGYVVAFWCISQVLLMLPLGPCMPFGQERELLLLQLWVPLYGKKASILKRL